MRKLLIGVEGSDDGNQTWSCGRRRLHFTEVAVLTAVGDENGNFLIVGSDELSVQGDTLDFKLFNSCGEVGGRTGRHLLFSCIQTEKIGIQRRW